jgi:hypothetical protein
MKKAVGNTDDDLRSEYDLAKRGPGIRGKYYRLAIADVSLFVMIDADAEEVLPAAEPENGRS